jgi:hypothetical protein
VTTYELDHECVWYLEAWDVQMETWTGVPPYTEFGSRHLGLQGLAAHKAKVPGGLAHLVEEKRSRWVIEGDREPTWGAARSRGGL